MLTDHYELTMIQAALANGTAHRQCVFEAFGRRLSGRRYGVVGGTGRILEAIRDFRYTPEQLDWLARNDVVNAQTIDWLADYRFSGTVHGYGEGDCYFPYSPVLIVEGTFAEAVVLETVILSILNHDSAIATAASRMATASDGRPMIEMGSRRTHEAAGVAAARMAYVCGFDATSNLQAGIQYGVPTKGTSAHAFTLLHDSEAVAFAAQAASLGTDTTLLVDTYDVPDGIRLAVETVGPNLGAIRLDSGDLVRQAHRARALLDELGATGTRILVTSDLDEYALAALASAPVDAYGVGTSLVTGSGVPTASMVYKLVAREDGEGRMTPVAKRSQSKGSVGGRKQAVRRFDSRGVAAFEVVGGDLARQDADRDLLLPLVREGEVVGTEPLTAARARWRAALAELPEQALKLSEGEPALPTVMQGTLIG